MGSGCDEKLLHDGVESSESLSVYIHIPFCETKCPYCDFNTYVGLENLVPSYIEALCAEIEVWGTLLGNPSVHTVFFGGGTPSYLPNSLIGAVMARIGCAFDVASEAEITLEANPEDISRCKLDSWRRLGINRISIGVQSFDDRLLRLLGRRHSGEEAIKAYRMAYQAGINNASIDLLYGIPFQTLEDWKRTVDIALELEVSHMSLYCLTLEGSTPMQLDVSDGTLPEPDPDLAADMYWQAEAAMENAGYRHYEISNWASPGMESRHNLAYWLNGAYLGIGPGAHSYMCSYRFSNLKSPQEYVRNMLSKELSNSDNDSKAEDILRAVPSVDTMEHISQEIQMAETIMLGLGLDVGVDKVNFEGRFGRTPDQVYGSRLSDLAALGLLTSTNSHIRLTKRGRFLSNEVFVRLFD